MGNGIFTSYKNLLKFIRLDKSERNIVIFSESGQDYHFFENIIKHICQSFTKEVCYLSSDMSDPVFELNNEMIKPIFIGNGLARTILFQIVEADVFVLTMEDLNNYHLKRSINKVHYVFIPHSMVSTHMIEKEDAYDHYDTICCVGPHHKQEIKKREQLYSLPSKNLLSCGFDRFDSLIKQRDVARLQNNKLTVLVAPSWGKDALLETCGKVLIEQLLSSQYRVLLRPHPQTVRLNPELIEDILQKFSNNNDFICNPKMDSFDNLVEADIIVSDWSGVALEFGLALEKPVLYIDVPKKCKNPNYTQLNIEPIEIRFRERLGRVISPQDVYKAGEVVEQMITEENLPDYNTLRLEAVFNIANSAYIIAEEIVKIADSSKDY